VTICFYSSFGICFCVSRDLVVSFGVNKRVQKRTSGLRFFFFFQKNAATEFFETRRIWLPKHLKDSSIGSFFFSPLVLLVGLAVPFCARKQSWVGFKRNI